jgi:hypothetical protein
MALPLLFLFAVTALSFWLNLGSAFLVEAQQNTMSPDFLEYLLQPRIFFDRNTKLKVIRLART